ncbi:MAG: hypothetical protein ABI620_06330, partial [Chloroflexota bacterium]
AIRAVQEMGVRVEVVSFRGNTSSDLMDVADLFTDIIQIAKVEKGSSRSGRRVAADDDLSMTEVPDKMTEGTGDRSRGRGRTRRVVGTPVAAAPATRSRSRIAAVPIEVGEMPAIVALPGEKLSRARVAATAAVGAEPSELDLDEAADGIEAGADPEMHGEDMSEEGRPRRRRRGGRGRGRSRGREDGPFGDAPATPEREPGAVAARDVDGEPDADEMPAPARRAASAFGSVWDSQIGIPAARRPAPATDDEEDYDEPAVPEYLITERRQRDGNRGGVHGGAGRGRGGAYAAALDRERFGGGRGSTRSGFQQPPAGNREPNFNRSDRVDRNDRPERMDRGDRQPFRPAARPAPRPSGDEPWSEVPPEIEAMLRAQLGSRPAAAPRREPAPAQSDAVGTAPSETAAPAPTASRRGRRPAAALEPIVDSTVSGTPVVDAPVKARRAPARRTAAAVETAESDAEVKPAAKAKAPAKAASTTTRRAATSRTRTVAAGTDSGTDTDAAPVAEEAVAPKRRATRKKADTTD